MATNTLTEIRCDHCDEAESEWHINKTALRSMLKEQGWKFNSRGDLCPRCVQQAKP